MPYNFVHDSFHTDVTAEAQFHHFAILHFQSPIYSDILCVLVDSR